MFFRGANIDEFFKYCNCYDELRNLNKIINMFTGIIENFGKVVEVISMGSNKTFWIESPLSNQLKIDESISHDGVCLTVEEIKNETYKLTAVKETIDKTNVENWKIGDMINLERAMKMDALLDGHIVQGHVDSTAICTRKKKLDGSIEFTFKYKKRFASLIIEKGSICVNGVSLTAFNVTDKKFTVTIIPYTLDHTNFKNLREYYSVNIEFDVLGKYVNRIIEVKK